MKPISPIVTQEYKALVRKACEYLTAREAELRDRYGLSTYQRFDWNQDKGTIVFSNDGVAGLLANIHLVGSVSTRTNTWLWSDRKSTRLNSSHLVISYAVFCLKKKKNTKCKYRLCKRHTKLN